jgi:site-specific recombinase XerC
MAVGKKREGGKRAHRTRPPWSASYDELRDLRKLRQQVTGLYVFETERGGPLSVDAVQYIVREAGREARLDVDVHPHMQRHAAGYTSELGTRCREGCDGEEEEV